MYPKYHLRPDRAKRSPLTCRRRELEFRFPAFKPVRSSGMFGHPVSTVNSPVNSPNSPATSLISAATAYAGELVQAPRAVDTLERMLPAIFERPVPSEQEITHS
jgi:hypothetical protein